MTAVGKPIFSAEDFLAWEAAQTEKHEYIAALPNFKREPVLIVEALPKATAAFDRGGKFAYYRRLPSLQEYALIDGERIAVDVFRRDAGGIGCCIPMGPVSSWNSPASV